MVAGAEIAEASPGCRFRALAERGIKVLHAAFGKLLLGRASGMFHAGCRSCAFVWCVMTFVCKNDMALAADVWAAVLGTGRCVPFEAI